MNERPVFDTKGNAAPMRRSLADVLGITAIARGLRRRWKMMLLVGSVATKVLHLVDVPVTLVK